MICNVTKDTVIADSFEKAETAMQQVRGLMFRKITPLVFFFDKEQPVELHSFFCKDSMDLILLNDEWEVVELRREWGPWKTFRSKQKASFLLELPTGSIFNSRTELGDIVHLK